MTTLLALDTATEACSVALLHDGKVLSHYEVIPRLHAQRLLPMVQALLGEAGVGAHVGPVGEFDDDVRFVGEIFDLPPSALLPSLTSSTRQTTRRTRFSTSFLFIARS